MGLIIEIATYILFFILMQNIIKRLDLIEAFLIIAIIIVSTFGEALNLFVYKTTAYTGRIGIPIYIIFGGVLIGWFNYKTAYLLVQKLNKNGLFSKLIIFFLISLLFPVIEIGGIKAGLWYWLKPYSISSPWWWLGVWKFYFFFLGLPSLLALIISKPKQTV